MENPRHLSEHAAQISAGMGQTGWQRFLAATPSLKVYNLPGGGRVVDRDLFYTLVAEYMAMVDEDEDEKRGAAA